MWPDFDAADLDAAVQEFNGRERRFGGVPAASAGAETVAMGGGR
jgi:undecaprenyl diphosphate synthase